jgi:hypothetical protein
MGENLVLRVGAFAMLDALGYRAKARKDPLGVVKRMLFLRKHARNGIEPQIKGIAGDLADMMHYIASGKSWFPSPRPWRQRQRTSRDQP